MLNTQTPKLGFMWLLVDFQQHNGCCAFYPCENLMGLKIVALTQSYCLGLQQ